MDRILLSWPAVVASSLLVVATALPTGNSRAAERLPSGSSMQIDSDTGVTVQSDEGAFAALGLGIGTPGGINFIGSVYSSPFGLRISGGDWGRNWRGIQADLSVTLGRGASLAQGLSIVVGAFRVAPMLQNSQGEEGQTVKKMTYGGLTYDLYLAGFFLQTGLGLGRGDYPDPQLLFQAGYLFRF